MVLDTRIQEGEGICFVETVTRFRPVVLSSGEESSTVVIKYSPHEPFSLSVNRRV